MLNIRSKSAKRKHTLPQDLIHTLTQTEITLGTILLEHQDLIKCHTHRQTTTQRPTGRDRKRQKETGRDRDRQTGRDRQRQTGTDRQRQTER